MQKHIESNRNTGKIRCAVVGCGRIGSSLEDDRLREKPASHAGAVAGNRETVLVAGADPDPDARSAFAKRWKLPASSVYATAEELFDTEKPDIVHITSDTDTHTPLLISALEHRVPVIVLEKPVSEDLSGARSALSMVEAAEKEGTSRVIINHERRFSDNYRRLRASIAGNEFGTLKALHCRLYMGLAKKPAQVLWHDGTHLVDIITFLAGDWEVTAVHGDSADTAAPFLAVGKTLSRNEPALITLDCSPGRDYLSFELDGEFSSGRVRIGNGIWETWKSMPSPYYETFRSLTCTSRGDRRMIRKTGYFSNMINHAVECFRNPETPAESSYRDGLAALEILDTIIGNRTLSE